MNNVHTGTKVEYRSNPEPTPDEVVYQPEVKSSSQTCSNSVEHEVRAEMYSYAQPDKKLKFNQNNQLKLIGKRQYMKVQQQILKI